MFGVEINTQEDIIKYGKKLQEMGAVILQILCRNKNAIGRITLIFHGGLLVSLQLRIRLLSF